MTTQDTARYIKEKLRSIYDESEAMGIGEWVLESLTGQSRTDRISQKESRLDSTQLTRLEQILDRLLTHEPVQYVLNESWFCGLKFYVDKNVLIPRPETEELVEWIISNCKFPLDTLRIIDIGSGSGCIAIALKRRLRKAEVWAIDKSRPALDVAKRNASVLGTTIHFEETDFLDQSKHDLLPSFDIIVSNPPYVPLRDKTTMQPNVLRYEPFEALFVPDNDPLVFYDAIARFGIRHLATGGNIYTEIHEDLGNATSKLFQSYGYATEIKKDMQGKDRMIKSYIP